MRRRRRRRTPALHSERCSYTLQQRVRVETNKSREEVLGQETRNGGTIQVRQGVTDHPGGGMLIVVDRECVVWAVGSS